MALKIDKCHTKDQVIEIKCFQNHPNMVNPGDMFQFSVTSGYYYLYITYTYLCHFISLNAILEKQRFILASLVPILIRLFSFSHLPGHRVPLSIPSVRPLFPL